MTASGPSPPGTLRDRVAQDDTKPEAGPWNDVILRSEATKNLTLPSICHPEGLFYRPIAPPEGEDLGVVLKVLKPGPSPPGMLRDHSVQDDNQTEAGTIIMSF